MRNNKFNELVHTIDTSGFGSDEKFKYHNIEWIDIKEKHPGNEIIVAYDVNGYYPPAVAHFETGKGFICLNGDNRTLWNVTHWFPLPKKPKILD